MEQSAPFETVTKLEVAERQLRVASRMFFERKDMIAIHSLATAAQDILRQLAKPRGIKSMMYDNDYIRAEKKEELLRLIRNDQNFFKHSGKDSDETLKFHCEGTKYHLHDPVMLWQALTLKPFAPEMGIFVAWFMRKHPHLFNPKDEQSPLKRAVLEKIHGTNFDFETVLEVIDKALRKEEVNTGST